MIHSHRNIFCGLLSSLVLLPAIALAQPSLTIINHFDKPLLYIVGTNPEVLPDLPVNFTLSPGEQAVTQVLDLKTEAYIRVEDAEQHSGFWGVEVTNNQTHVHGYMSKGLAFSWDREKIVFCTPEEYKQHNSCF